MARLLWKEWREKRLWALLLAASILAPILFGRGYLYSCLGEPIGAWLSALPALIVALLLGAASFSSELARGTAHFLYSRPISWKKILLAKILLGLAIVVAGALLAVILSAALRPERYARFVTTSSLAAALAYRVRDLGFAYLLGAVCAVVLPGVIGGVLTLLAMYCGILLHLLALTTLTDPTSMSFAYAWPVGAALATILAARAWLTLSTGARVGRYALVVLVVVALGTPVALCLQPRSFRLPHSAYLSFGAVSPDGRYALKTDRWNAPRDFSTVCFVRLSDGWNGTLALPQLDLVHTYWTPSGAVFFPAGGTIHVLRMDRQGRVRAASVSVPGDLWRMRPSPDSRFAMVRSHAGLRFVDIEKATLLKTVIPEAAPQEYWWQSNTEIGYVDTRGQRHIARITD